jgi:hypothetical protein
VIVVPSASLLVPLTDVDPAQSGEFTTGVTELLCTVTEDEVELIHFAVAWAVAVMTSPATNAVRPDLVHAPDDTVVVPTETPPFNTVIVVPSASVLVPLTEVVPGHSGEVTTGVAEML